MPEVERTPGKVTAYLIPTTVAVEATRSSHLAWLASEPNTKGENKTWCLWFRKNPYANKSSDYEKKWSEYRLAGEAYTDPVTARTGGSSFGSGTGSAVVGSDGGFKSVIETARQMISKAAGVPLEAVKITIGF